ncbi:N-(5'-phosphoribosyl)anthranilate isomerase [Candidatus Omnitrophota bacterium]
MVKIKICGLTSLDDASMAWNYGADLLGFIFAEGTKRFIELNEASHIIRQLKSRFIDLKAVGLFVKEDLSDIAYAVAHCDLDLVQLHGSETPDECADLKKLVKDKYDREIEIIKAFRVADEIQHIEDFDLEDYTEADYFVFDTFHPGLPGGTGEKFNWDVLNRQKEKISKPFFLAGGLTPGNISEAIQEVQPYGIDVSSGIEEKPRIKDQKLLKEFIDNARNTKIT